MVGLEAAIEFVSRHEFEQRVGSEHARATFEHVDRSIAANIDLARDVLGYEPRYSTLDALRDSVRHLAASGQIELGAGI